MSDENPQPNNNNFFANRQVPLSLYTFITRPGINNVVQAPQNIELIVAFTQDEAMAALATKFPTGTPFTIDFKGLLPMVNVMDMFNKIVTQNNTLAKPESELVTRTKRDYYKEIIQGMLKSVNDFTDQPEVLTAALNKMLTLVQ